MSLKRVLLAVAAVALVGCGQGPVSETDQTKLRKEFSHDNYDKAMEAQGKSKELAEEKKRNEEYLKAGNPGNQDAGQH